MGRTLDKADQELVIREVQDCVRTGGDVAAVVASLQRRIPGYWERIAHGAAYVEKHERELMAEEAAAAAERAALLADDIAMVEDLIQRLPAVLARLRASEAAS